MIIGVLEGVEWTDTEPEIQGITGTGWVNILHVVYHGHV